MSTKTNLLEGKVNLDSWMRANAYLWAIEKSSFLKQVPNESNDNIKYYFEINSRMLASGTEPQLMFDNVKAWLVITLHQPFEFYEETGDFKSTNILGNYNQWLTTDGYLLKSFRGPGSDEEKQQFYKEQYDSLKNKSQ